MAIVINFKQGDTFVLECIVKIDNVVQNITDWTIASKVKLPSANFEDTLVVTKTDAINGVFQVKKQDTTAWPSGLISPKLILCDIEYTLGNGQIISTENFTIASTTGIT